MQASSLTAPGNFDVPAFLSVADAQREERGMSLNDLSRTIRWMNPKTLERMFTRQSSSNNHILPLVQWVGQASEAFTVSPAGAVQELLPDPGPRGWRWWWNLKALLEAVDEQRQDRGLTWVQVGDEMNWRLNFKALEKLRYGTGIGESMIMARWVGRSAASFMTDVPPGAWNKLYEVRQAVHRGDASVEQVQQMIGAIQKYFRIESHDLKRWKTKHFPG